MPLHKKISPFKSVPRLKDFDADEFMRNLKQAGPELTSSLRGDWPGLYKWDKIFCFYLKLIFQKINCC